MVADFVTATATVLDEVGSVTDPEGVTVSVLVLGVVPLSVMADVVAVLIVVWASKLDVMKRRAMPENIRHQRRRGTEEEAWGMRPVEGVPLIRDEPIPSDVLRCCHAEEKRR
jgi:hypothetical protein